MRAIQVLLLKPDNPMTLPENLETDRLILRRWKDSDLEPFARLNNDERVMQYFPRLIGKAETQRIIEDIENTFEEHEMGLWAVDIKKQNEFVGFVGLWIPKFKADFMPCIEIGWRLLHEHWGHGYAPEAAVETLRDGFERLKLKEIHSFTTVHNRNSIRVMEKIGMSRINEFDHPSVPKGHFLRPHVLYHISRQNWLETHSQDS